MRRPGTQAAGKAGALMSGPVVLESVTVAGRAERARVARAFTVAVLGPGHPCGDDAALLVGELFGNSVRHSRSGVPGETVTVTVRAGDGVVRVEVTDRSGPGAPELRPGDSDAEVGRGLQLVAGLAAGGARAGAAAGRCPGSSCGTADISTWRWTWRGPGLYLAWTWVPVITRQAQV
jgi:serine/threonine-protein kinase RsbW